MGVGIIIQITAQITQWKISVPLLKPIKFANNLAQQVRDPSLGVTSFNRAIVLHQLHKSKEASKYFFIAKRYARGDSRILNSQLLKNYTN